MDWDTRVSFKMSGQWRKLNSGQMWIVDEKANERISNWVI
jgi:hypothetical protein